MSYKKIGGKSQQMKPLHNKWKYDAQITNYGQSCYEVQMSSILLYNALSGLLTS